MAETAGERLSGAIRAGFLRVSSLMSAREALLAAAAAQADDVEALEADVLARGHVLDTGRLNPCVQEARQGRSALGRLLAGLDLPDSRSVTGIRASKAANTRWRAAS